MIQIRIRSYRVNGLNDLGAGDRKLFEPENPEDQVIYGCTHKINRPFTTCTVIRPGTPPLPGSDSRGAVDRNRRSWQGKRTGDCQRTPRTSTGTIAERRGGAAVGKPRICTCSCWPRRFKGGPRLFTDCVVPVFGCGVWLMGFRRVAVLPGVPGRHWLGPCRGGLLSGSQGLGSWSGGFRQGAQPLPAGQERLLPGPGPAIFSTRARAWRTRRWRAAPSSPAHQRDQLVAGAGPVDADQQPRAHARGGSGGWPW